VVATTTASEPPWAQHVLARRSGVFRAYGEPFYPLEDGWTQLWDDIEGVMQQLAHNMTLSGAEISGVVSRN